MYWILIIKNSNNKFDKNILLSLIHISYDNLSGLIPTAITGGLVQTVLTHPIVNTLVLPSLLKAVLC